MKNRNPQKSTRPEVRRRVFLCPFTPRFWAHRITHSRQRKNRPKSRANFQDVKLLDSAIKSGICFDFVLCRQDKMGYVWRAGAWIVFWSRKSWYRCVPCCFKPHPSTRADTHVLWTRKNRRKKPTFWLGRQIIRPATQLPLFDRFSHSAQGVNEAYCAARI